MRTARRPADLTDWAIGLTALLIAGIVTGEWVWVIPIALLGEH